MPARDQPLWSPDHDHLNLCLPRRPNSTTCGVEIAAALLEPYDTRSQPETALLYS